MEALRTDFASLADRREPMLLLHRVADPKNACVRSDRSVALFDWDYAGPAVIESELLAATLPFAGGPVAADASLVYATIKAYRAECSRSLDFHNAAPRILNEGFRWMMFNAWRALGHRDVTGDERRLGASLVHSLAPAWPATVRAVRSWVSLVSD